MAVSEFGHSFQLNEKLVRCIDQLFFFTHKKTKYVIWLWTIPCSWIKMDKPITNESSSFNLHFYLSQKKLFSSQIALTRHGVKSWPLPYISPAQHIFIVCVLLFKHGLILLSSFPLLLLLSWRSTVNGGTLPRGCGISHRAARRFGILLTCREHRLQGSVGRSTAGGVSLTIKQLSRLHPFPLRGF